MYKFITAASALAMCIGVTAAIAQPDGTTQQTTTTVQTPTGVALPSAVRATAGICQFMLMRKTSSAARMPPIKRPDMRIELVAIPSSLAS